MTVASRDIEAILLVNWKSGKLRLKKRLGKDNPGEIPIRIKLKINIPEAKVFEVNGEITTTQATTERLVLEAI